MRMQVMCLVLRRRIVSLYPLLYVIVAQNVPERKKK